MKREISNSEQQEINGYDSQNQVSYPHLFTGGFIDGLNFVCLAELPAKFRPSEGAADKCEQRGSLSYTRVGKP